MILGGKTILSKTKIQGFCYKLVTIVGKLGNWQFDKL